MASSPATSPPVNQTHVELLHQRLLAEGKVVFKNGSVAKLSGESVTVRWKNMVERGYSLRTLDRALDFAVNGSGREAGPLRRRYPGRPACYRPPETIAKELRGFHKEGVLLDVPVPEVAETAAPPEPTELPDDQPF